jgi:hypothetical protein
MQRTTPVPQKLGELVATLQGLLDKGLSPETVVHVFDADASSYQPVSLASYGDGSLKIHLHADEEYDDEIPRWQNAIRELCVSECGHDVDGSGCDSGDPLDLTLSELSQAFNTIRDSYEWLDSQPPADAGEILVFCGDGNYRFVDAANAGTRGINWEYWSKPWQLRKAASSE